MKHYPIEPRTRTYVKGYQFLPFTRNLSNTYRKHFQVTIKNRTRYSKNCF